MLYNLNKTLTKVVLPKATTRPMTTQSTVLVLCCCSYILAYAWAMYLSPLPQMLEAMLVRLLNMPDMSSLPRADSHPDASELLQRCVPNTPLLVSDVFMVFLFLGKKAGEIAPARLPINSIRKNHSFLCRNGSQASNTNLIEKLEPAGTFRAMQVSGPRYRAWSVRSMVIFERSQAFGLTQS